MIRVFCHLKKTKFGRWVLGNCIRDVKYFDPLSAFNKQVLPCLHFFLYGTTRFAMLSNAPEIDSTLHKVTQSYKLYAL